MIIFKTADHEISGNAWSRDRRIRGSFVEVSYQIIFAMETEN